MRAWSFQFAHAVGISMKKSKTVADDNILRTMNFTIHFFDDLVQRAVRESRHEHFGQNSQAVAHLILLIPAAEVRKASVVERQELYDDLRIVHRGRACWRRARPATVRTPAVEVRPGVRQVRSRSTSPSAFHNGFVTRPALGLGVQCVLIVVPATDTPAFLRT